MDTKDLKMNSIDIEHLDLSQTSSKKPRLLASLKEIIIYAIIFIMCVFVLPRYVIQKTIVDGDSMETTLHDKDRLLLDKLTYQFKNPERFDIIVFYPYGKDVDEYYVKRVIGLPEETVQIIGEDIYINGDKLEENYGKDPITYSGIAEEPLTLGDDEFFLLGDNREISLDSRYEEVGLVHRDMIAGHAIVRIWPFDKFGIVK
ncbi:signal peptidase I [Mobilisporobacter senegalensis]|uniref:Signal peptidase I n=1 Tax=Mobilisporobacter senegalensis TaxID=1329262 RepID=A0A3N1XVT3_9FIRM|nr:signal peptidase I [Mobilisporobacter senegalensis]ROR30713.1 signal peptidase I [Mobilisporobacter senegalensis]